MFILYVTSGGRDLAERLALQAEEARVLPYSEGAVAEAFGRKSPLVFIGALGIAVRAIAPYLRDKYRDPPVVVIDEAGRFVISLVSGHLGGGNELAQDLAAYLKAIPVVTTASDVRGLPALDVWARSQGLVVENWWAMRRAQALLVQKRSLLVYKEISGLELPLGLEPTAWPETAQVIISFRPGLGRSQALRLYAKVLAIGVGVNRGTRAEEVIEAIETVFREHDLCLASAAVMASAWVKKDEPGLYEAARALDLPIKFFSREEIVSVPVKKPSAAVVAAIGVPAVAEPCALLASGAKEILVPKVKKGNVTVAVARSSSPLLARSAGL
ncbi:cobalamin biosynthesis protein CbiG [Thermosulfuriphilus ammonigenes]|nr:cobalamin biosynthesis protein [Thermosulfuriphilus ammonigenes]MBA2849334.1 cobalamin biosynthesis protein CbiG [Thermosulfuriphilus ammonigenes]